MKNKKVDKKMLEMAQIYHLSLAKKIKYIYFPAFFPNLYQRRLKDVNKGAKIK